jgi:inorganic triphosphatase YgiF
MSVEPELKFRVAKGKLRSVAEMHIEGAHRGQRTNGKLISTYFDTPKHKFRRHGLTLRVRQEGPNFRQTVKSLAAGSFARGEWEADVPDGGPSFRDLDGTPLAPLATRKLKRKLEPIFRTSVDRVTRPLQVGASEIELAVDRGKLIAGRETRPIAEFELELKKGRAADLFRMARQFERKTGAELDLRSKAERGYGLATGDEQIVFHAEDVELDEKMTTNEAFDVIALSTLRHFTSNADAVRELDAEAIHQMRVGLRRLRAAISLFSDVLPTASTEEVKSELKWLTSELAPARAIDVFVTEKIEPLRRTADPKRGIRAIEKQFAARREQAFRHARHALATPRYRKLPLDVLEWLESRRPGAAAESNTPIGEFAAKVMRRRIKKARKQGRDLPGLSAQQQHKLRINIKKIRYGVDFFRSLYPADAQDDLERLSDRLEKSQDALGALNDFIAHREMAEDAALHAPRKNRRARAFASGLLVGQEREATKTLLTVASKAIRGLKPSSVELG